LRNKLLLIITAFMLMSSGSGVYAAPKLTLIVNGQVSSAETKLIKNSTYVPLRAAAELLGTKVDFNPATKTVTITSKTKVVKITRDKSIIIKSTTYVPLRSAAELLGSVVNYDGTTKTITITSTRSGQAATEYDVKITFPADRYVETAAHIAAAIKGGESAICTIDRAGADQNRDESLAGISTKEGYDRDEWPMAMCAEGGKGASVVYVESSDNRGAGAWVGNQLEDYPNGTKVLFVIDASVNESISNANGGSTEEETVVNENIVYKNCTEVRQAGKAPIRIGNPGYSRNLDRDGDGIGCEAA
jgi:hypothetical protein